jgi:hypothetical protein
MRTLQALILAAGVIGPIRWGGSGPLTPEANPEWIRVHVKALESACHTLCDEFIDPDGTVEYDQDIDGWVEVECLCSKRP